MKLLKYIFIAVIVVLVLTYVIGLYLTMDLLWMKTMGETGKISLGIFLPIIMGALAAVLLESKTKE